MERRNLLLNYLQSFMLNVAMWSRSFVKYTTKNTLAALSHISNPVIIPAPSYPTRPQHERTPAGVRPDLKQHPPPKEHVSGSARHLWSEIYKRARGDSLGYHSTPRLRVFRRNCLWWRTWSNLLRHLLRMSCALV